MSGSCQVAVIGAGICSEAESAAAYAVGKVLAENCAILVCGGTGGVMEAACHGARDYGGVTVGIVPDTGNGNQFLTIVIRSGMGHARNVLVVQSADAVISIGGKEGTLSEIAHSLKTGRRVFTYRSWDIPGVIECTTPEEAALRAVASARRTRLAEPG